MTDLFIPILKMSITASYAALAVMLVRVFLKKAPRVFSYALWLVVLFRLICPFSLESSLSLIPSKPASIPQEIVYSQTPAINSGMEIINNASPVNPAASADPMIIVMDITAIIWLVGIAVLLCYGAVSYFRLKHRLSVATFVKDNIFETDRIQTPFVLGLIKPRIYIPTGITGDGLDYILKHEQTHIKRYDYLIKPVAYLALTLHWFNPLIWFCYFLMSKDMEMSCDESVMRDTDEDVRGSYSTALLTLSAKQSGLIIPLAFGESNVKSRIKNILNYKKPAFWVIIVAVVVVALALIGLVTNPKDKVKILTPAEQFLKYKTEYVGDASKVSNIIRLLNFPDKVNYDYLELHTESSPYAVTVNLKTDTETRDYYAELLHQAAFEKNAIIMFSLIGNVDSINFKLTDDRNDYLLQYARDWANDYMGRDVRQFAQSEEEFARFLGMLDYSSSDVGGADNRISAVVEKKLDIILSSPKTSSNPQDYMDAHQDEYGDILKEGEKALNYMLAQFEKGVNDDLRGQIMMRLCKQILGNRNNVTDETLSPQEWFSSLSIRQETKLPDFVYAGSNSLEKLVYDTEITQHSDPRRGFTIVAPKIFGSYKEGNKLKVFVTTYSATYRLYDKALSEEMGGIVPAAITYRKKDEGSYIMEEYKQAQDGSLFVKSIRQYCTMPVSGKKIPGLADKILNHYGDYNDIITLQRENLIQHLKANNQDGVSLHSPSDEIIKLT
jgi:beta-lactamase regulating signal transducer with metallopeptidase domain